MTAMPADVRVKTVARYTYHLFSSRTQDDLMIYLYDANSDVLGHVYFVADDQPLPAASETHGIVALYFPRSGFASVMDMLRNEGPIELRWAGPFDSCLSTAFETVGEGERSW